MSSNITLTTRVSALETGVAEIKGSLALIAEHFGLNKPEAVAVEAAPAKAAKGKGKKAKAAKAQVVAAPTTKVLTRVSLREFKATKAGKAYAAANPGASASGILDGRFPMPEGFHAPTGERKAAIAEWKEQQAEAPKAKKGKKGKGAKGTKEVVVAVMETSAKARTLTPAQQARIEAPRRADGTVTPKVEWPLRESLALSGKYDRHEIDAKVAAAHAAGVFA